MFTRRYHLFRMFDLDVRLDLSWLLLAVLVTWSLARGFFPVVEPDLPEATYWWMAVAGTLGLLFSILFHETSHALLARRYGLPVHSITLFVFGGVAEMSEEPRDARTEFLVAVIGPIASLFLALVFWLLYRTTAGDEPTAFHGVMNYLAMLNVVLAVFNLIPAFPLDGGRMLRAALWHWRGNFHRATRIAARIGSGFGMVLIVLGMVAFLNGNYIGGMWWFLIGLFLRNAAGMSYQQLIIRETIHGEPVRRFMNSNPISVSRDISLTTLVDDYLYRHHHKMYPVVDHGRALGSVSAEQLKAVSRTEWDRRTVGDIMEPCSIELCIEPDTDALEAWTRMSRTGRSRLLIVENGKLKGILTLRDLMHFLSLKFDLEQLQA